VKALLSDDQGRLLSVGEDGFLALWSLEEQGAVEHFQLSPYSISSMSLRPGKTEAALLENDGLGLYRLSAWDYKAKRQLFTQTFREPLSFIGYSGGGTFLIAARSGSAGLLFIHPETGKTLPSALKIAGTVSLAATGRSERTMIAYLPSGLLSYWEVERGTEILSLSVPANIASPCLFANNNCLGGFDSQGFLVINAVSGEVILREPAISRGILVPGNPERGELVCIAPDGPASFAFNRQGRLERTASPAFTGIPRGITCGIIARDRMVLGGADGRVWSAGPRESFRALAAENQRLILDGASSGNILALTFEGGGLGFIPLDYRELRDRAQITVEEGNAFTHVRGDETGGNGGTARFILWREGTDGDPPQLRTLYAPDASETLSLDLSLRNPILTASILGDRLLFLDTGGTITLVSTGEGNRKISLPSPGTLDAAFLDRENLIIGRSTGATPFLKIHLGNGETVPLSYPAEIGIRVYPGSGGRIYGGIITMREGESRTGLIRLDLSGQTPPVLLASFPGEDTDFDMTETGSTLAATLGDRGASVYGPGGERTLERSAGLPVRLFKGKDCFIALDGEGSAAWYDDAGQRLALLRMYDTVWFLERGDGEILTGKVLKRVRG
jgi:hypothetical protein